MKGGYISLGDIIVNGEKNPKDCEAVVNIMGKRHIARGSGATEVMAFAEMLEKEYIAHQDSIAVLK